MSNRVPRRSRVRSKEIDPTRIGQLLRLALSSDQAGEVTAAVGALKRALAASDIDLHDLAEVVEAGLGGQQPPAAEHQRRTTWGPPSPRSDDWQSMCWYLHHHRHQLRPHQREFVEDTLLGRGFDDGRITSWQLEELRSIVRSLTAAPTRWA